jgi:hypothetical protein
VRYITQMEMCATLGQTSSLKQTGIVIGLVYPVEGGEIVTACM